MCALKVKAKAMLMLLDSNLVWLLLASSSWIRLLRHWHTYRYIGGRLRLTATG